VVDVSNRIAGEAEPIESGQVALKDGRFIGWTAWGAPDGVPVLAQPHLGVSGRRNLAKYVEPITAAGVRLIQISRAGLGGSTANPYRSVVTDAHDMLDVADSLKLDELTLYAQCSGSGPAIVLAARRPERVSKLLLASPAAPLRGPDADTYTNATLRSLRRIFRFRFLACMWAKAQRRGYARDPQRWLDRGWQTIPEPDRRELDDPQLRELTRLEIDELYRSPDLLIAEWCSVVGPWDVDLGAIRSRVLIDHGRLDRTTPVAMGIWLGEQIPGAAMRIHEDRGHNLGEQISAAILSELASAQGSR
jgi:pimeloyl-ACP methyl ester carboxylesterase